MRCVQQAYIVGRLMCTRRKRAYANEQAELEEEKKTIEPIAQCGKLSRKYATDDLTGMTFRDATLFFSF